jgi:hypothetical protein
MEIAIIILFNCHRCLFLSLGCEGIGAFPSAIFYSAIWQPTFRERRGSHSPCKRLPLSGQADDNGVSRLSFWRGSRLKVQNSFEAHPRIFVVDDETSIANPEMRLLFRDYFPRTERDRFQMLRSAS